MPNHYRQRSTRTASRCTTLRVHAPLHMKSSPTLSSPTTMVLTSIVCARSSFRPVSSRFVVVYYLPNAPEEAKYAAELHERIRREFPEVRTECSPSYRIIALELTSCCPLQLRIYRVWDKPVGPHPVPMFEVNVFNPHQTGTLFSWPVINRGPCS